MWMGVGCPYPPVRNNIVTLRHLLTHHSVVHIAHSLPSAPLCYARSALLRSLRYARSIHDWQTDDGQTEPLVELFVRNLKCFNYSFLICEKNVLCDCSKSNYVIAV